MVCDSVRPLGKTGAKVATIREKSKDDVTKLVPRSVFSKKSRKKCPFRLDEKEEASTFAVERLRPDKKH